MTKLIWTFLLTIFVVLLFILFRLTFATYKLYKANKHESIEKRVDTLSKTIGIIVTIIIALIGNLLVITTYEYQRGQDTHAQLIEKLNYTYEQPEVVQEKFEDGTLYIPVKIDVCTGELSKYTVIDFHDGKIHGMKSENIAQMNKERSEGNIRILTLLFKKESEYEGPTSFCCYLLVEGMDGSNHLDRLAFIVDNNGRIIEWEPYYYTSLIGFDALSEDYKAEFKEYRELYSILQAEDII